MPVRQVTHATPRTRIITLDLRETAFAFTAGNYNDRVFRILDRSDRSEQADPRALEDARAGLPGDAHRGVDAAMCRPVFSRADHARQNAFIAARRKVDRFLNDRANRGVLDPLTRDLRNDLSSAVREGRYQYRKLQRRHLEIVAVRIDPRVVVAIRHTAGGLAICINAGPLA